MTVLATETLTDAEVVRRVLDGDTALFELILRRYNQRIYRVVRGILRDEAEVEDAMQQAYINAFQHLGQWAERALFSTWLTRIALNEALARVRRRNVMETEIMDTLESPSPGPEELALAGELRQVVEQEIASLGAGYRSVLMLREVEGLSTAEVAELLDVSEDVVKTRLHRARTMLREGLYRRAGVTFESLFPFGQSRCDALVERVMARIHQPRAGRH